MTTRRSFLTSMAGVGGALFAGPALAVDPWSICSASSTPPGAWDTNPLEPPVKVLEIFLEGGASTHELFAWEGGVDPMFSGVAAVPHGSYGMSPEPFSGTTWLAPALEPLFAVKNNLRLVALRHEHEPHLLAVPLGLNGLDPGRPACAGTGALVEAKAGLDPAKLHALVLHSAQGIGTLESAVRTGQFGGSHRPLALGLGGASIATKLGARTAEEDALIGFYGGRYQQRLTHGSAVVRSEAFDQWLAAACRVKESKALGNILGSLDLTVPNASTVGTGNATAKAIQAARELFDASDVEYCCVVDSGLQGNYDRHGALASDTNNAQFQYDNMINVAQAVAAHFTTSGAVDAGFLIVINTEFGRRPDGDGGGDHNPEGYHALLLGDAVESAGVFGEFDAQYVAQAGQLSTGSDYEPTPEHLRAAVLRGLNISARDASTLDWGASAAPDEDAVLEAFFGGTP